MTRFPGALALLLVLGGCGSSSTTPGAMSGSEAQALDDAAAMLDANSVDANAATFVDTHQDDTQ
ncbi:hypothetical protein AWL63_05350 [Sphingomonas panacis]|uniref:Uncharacterized protein n=1 Tax=Sphingomonas panacis TaxID=1560345 RepID=A0A1B3Z7U8_9SPHN|nr:hypothetical protein [Sphingomonas panacis]AOH83479.1 hypothetical protein AWL63_05350 [Sphingomonas panacis]